MLQRGVPHLHDAVADLVASNIWILEHHGLGAIHAKYRDEEAARYVKLRETLDAVADATTNRQTNARLPLQPSLPLLD
jgi:hypothetical protein